MTGRFLPFTTVVAWVMKGREFFMPGFIDLDSSCLDVLFQQIMD
jgi:hypothetical protein